MYELNGEEVTLEFLQGKAQEYGMDIDSYLETMKKKGLVEKTNGSQTEDATAEPVNTASSLEDTSLELPEIEEFDPSKTDLTVGSNVRYMAGTESLPDFSRNILPNLYEIYREQDLKEAPITLDNPKNTFKVDERFDRKNIEELKQQIIPDFKVTYSAGGTTGTGGYYTSPVKLTPEQAESNRLVKEEIQKQKQFGKNQVRDISLANFFSQSLMIKEITKELSIQEFAAKNPNGGDLRKAFKSYFENLPEEVTNGISQKDADEVFQDVFAHLQDREKQTIKKQTEQIAVDDAISKGVPLQELTDSLNESIIKTYGGDKNFKEQQLAFINEKERKWGKKLISMSLEEYEDMMKTKAKIIDDLYYEDEVIEDYLPGGEVVRRRTGKRIPKEEEYKMFHDLVLGHNIENPSSSEATVGTQEITDLYKTFLSTYKNTSLGSLEKINDRLLIEEAGYDIEGKQKIDVKVTDPALIEALSLLQHTGEVKKTDKTGRFEVTLNALTAASADGNKWWSIDAQIFDEKIDELAPADGFEGKPYSNGQEFLDYLNVRRRRGASIKAEKAALWKLYHLNEDITSIGDNRWGRFFQSTLAGLGVDEENIPKVIGYTDAKVQDVISQSILPDMGKFGSYDPETGVGLSEDQSRYLERDFSDKLVETAGGLTGMTPGLIGLNKVQGVLGINRLIGSLMAPKYFVKGKQLSNTSISKFALSKGKSVDDLVTQGVVTKRSATNWEKAQALVVGGIAEDVKMREGMGAIGMQQFERGVGFGFFVGSRLLPYDFRTFEVFGKKRNQLNTFLNLTAKNGPAFAIAAEAGEAINATIEDLQGNQEFMTFVKKHWGDYGENLERTILHLITGTSLGAFHLKKNDVRTTEQISQFNQLAAQKMIVSESSLKEKAIEEGIKVSNEEAYAAWLNKKYSNNDPLAMEAIKYQQDFMMSMEYLSRVNDIDAWTDPVKGQKLWNEYFEPVRQEFLQQGKELVVKFSDKPLRQEYIDADGKIGYNESSALYTRISAKEGGAGKAIVEVYIPAGKGRGTAGHEMLHAYLDLMFDGKPKLKEAFESSLRETLQKVTLLNGESLFNAIVQDQALVKKGKDGSVDLAATKQIRFEEMMAYTAEYLAKAENQNLYDSRTLSTITKFFNNFSKSKTGKNADLYTGKDLVNLLAHYGKTGKVSDLKKLEQYVELGVETSDVLASAAEGKKELVTKVINDYSNFAKEKGKENTELFKAKPEGYKELMAKNVEAIRDAKNNIETIEKAMDQGNPRVELNKYLYEQMIDPATKEISFRPKFTKEQINKELAEGKGEAKDAIFETQRQVMNSALIENLIKQGVVGNQIPKGGLAEIEFVEAVKQRLENKFRNEFNPEINDNVFGWFTGTSGGQGKSIIFRAKGDVMNKYNKQVKLVSKEVIEGFDNMFADNTGGAGEGLIGGEAPLIRQRFTETVEYKQEALDIIENAAIRENIDVDGLTYKDVKNLVAGQTLTNGKVPTSAKNVEATGPLKDILEVVGEKHGIPLERILANQTLTSGMRNKAREVIFEEARQKIDALPEGTTPSGKSTGIANTKLGEFYVKGEAVKMAETGSKQGLAEQTKQDIRKNDFLEMFGIKPDGTMLSGTKFDGAIREYLKQEASIIANQAARQHAGKPEAKIGEGRSIKMATVLRDNFIEKFSELNVEQIRDKFLYRYHNVEEALTKAEKDFFKTSKFDEVFQNREDAIAFALMESRVVAGKTKQFQFEGALRGDKYSDITLNNGLKIDGKKINLLDISATTRRQDGQIVVDVPKVKEMIKHSLNVAELLPASLSKNKSLFTEMLFMHRRTNLEGYSKESKANRLAEGKKDIITETGESVAGLDITRSKDKAVSRAGLKELVEIWKDVVIEFNSATSQVTGAKNMRKAKTDLEREQIAEKYFSQLSERSKESVYDAMGKTLEYYVKEAKTEAEFLSRAEYVMRGMRSNSDLRLGFRQLAQVIAVYKGKAIFDANQLKLEHLKTSAAQSYKAGQLIVSGQWSSMGKESLKDFVGVIAPRELLDIIDAKGGKTNMEALYRMAMLEPTTLKDFVTIESGGKENLLDYVLREGKKQLSRDAIKESLGAKKLLEAANKNIENGTGIKVKLDAQVASRTQKEIDAALTLGRVANKKSRGGSFFDFDETLVDKGKNFIVATKGNQTVKISSGQWPLQGPKYAAEGWKFDFKDFVNVRGGVEGPLFKKFKERLNKFGPEHMYIVTARPAESAPAIHSWLKSKGVEIPLENITGLGNSTGEAKALYMLKKFSEGYNDMYFVDDALPNVKAVKNVLSQLDIKSDVQQAIASRDFNKEVNDILEYSLGIQSKKVFSKAEAKVRGKDIKRRRFFIPDTAADLELLLEPMYGKGKQGVKNKKWFEENFIRKWERGINDFNKARQTITNDYMSLRKKNKDIVKQLPEAVENTNFTLDQAIRVYIWNKNGYTIPDLAPTTQQKLVKHIINNPKLQAYAESLAKLTKVEGGLKEPSAEWWGETIATEIQDLGKGIGRKKYIQDFIDSKNEIFSESNLNKMESKLGSNWRETIEDMFDRMETGRTRSMRIGKTGNALMNYLNGSTGAIMNFNTRSAALQLISTVNFVNSSFNNPLMAAKAFANQPQYWKDFMTIMNSDMLKQRRQGLEINVSEAELAAVASQSKNPARAVLAKILKAGYLPTKIADSFAIASGGATYYRNAINKYMKEGLSRAEAERKAFVDFQAIAERTQQSSRADLLSKQQTSFEGRLILAFANTPMQMNRIMMKDVLDISKGRYKGFYGEGSLTSKMSRIGYYGFVQSLIFAGLQSGAFALMTNSDDEKKIAESKLSMLNTVADSFLRGMGIRGAVVNGIRLAIQEFVKQDGKKYNADYSEVAEKLLNISPTVGSKFSKLDAAGNTYNYNKKVIKEEGLTLNGPLLEAGTQVIESTTNLPLNRYYKKGNNIQNALDDSYYNWQRVLSASGWNVWGLGEGKDKSRVRIKNKGKETEYTKYLTKEDLRREQVEEEIKKREKKEKRAKQQRCTKVKSDGTRCKIMVNKPKSRCHYHD